MDGLSRICRDSTAKYHTELFTAVSLLYHTVTYSSCVVTVWLLGVPYTVL